MPLLALAHTGCSRLLLGYTVPGSVANRVGASAPRDGPRPHNEATGEAFLKQEDVRNSSWDSPEEPENGSQAVPSF